MSEYFKIGYISKSKGTTIRTLRFYDRINLLKPSKVDEFTNYRYYSIDQFFKLEMIIFLRSLDISIADIKYLFDNGNLKKWETFFMNTEKKTEMQISNLQLSIIKMQKFREHINFINDIKDEKSIYFKTIKERMVITRDCSSLPSSDEGINKFQEIYYELSENLSDKNLLTSYITGSLFSFTSSFTQLTREKIFINIHCFDSLKPSNTFILPKGKYLCINHKWDDFKEKEKLLLDYLKNNNFIPKLAVEQEAFLDFCGYANPLSILQILIE